MKKAKGTKKCVMNKMLKFEDYKKCLFDNEPMLKSQQRRKNYSRLKARIMKYTWKISTRLL